MITFQLEQQAAAGLINVLGQLPTNSGVFPLLTQLVMQYNEQIDAKKGTDDGAVTEPA